MKKEEKIEKKKRKNEDDLSRATIIGNTYFPSISVTSKGGVYASDILKGVPSIEESLVSPARVSLPLSLDQVSKLPSVSFPNTLGVEGASLRVSDLMGNLEKPTITKEEVEKMINDVAKEGDTEAVKKQMTEMAQDLQTLKEASRNLVAERENLLSREDEVVIQKMLNSPSPKNKKDVKEWRCVACNHFLDNFDSLEKIKNYLMEFRQGKYKICEKNRHHNQFFIKDGKITFALAPRDLLE
ncbi:MAG: hypothetical protein WCT22_03255 [Patescibacteria group bacterium]